MLHELMMAEVYSFKFVFEVLKLEKKERKLKAWKFHEVEFLFKITSCALHLKLSTFHKTYT